MGYEQLINDVFIRKRAPVSERRFVGKLVPLLSLNLARSTTRTWSPEKMVELISLRYGLAGMRNHTRSELARHFDVSIERVRQIEVITIRKLRELASNGKFVA